MLDQEFMEVIKYTELLLLQLTCHFSKNSWILYQFSYQVSPGRVQYRKMEVNWSLARFHELLFL